MEFIPGEQRSKSRLARILLKRTVVRFEPSGKRKTGRLGKPVGPNAVWTRDFRARVRDSSCIWGRRKGQQTLLWVPLISET
jgi:hypothetical protein